MLKRERMASNLSGNKLGEGHTEKCLISSLQSLCKENDGEKARAALETLLTLANNIIKYPENEKYRKVRIENKSFNLKVWNLPDAQQFLLYWGWIEVDGFVVLNSDEDVQLIRQILQKKLNAFPRQSSARPSKSEPFTEKEKQLQEERRKQRERKEAEEKERARIRAQIQADRKSEKDREIRDSKGKQLKFGGKMTKFEDIGVDLNKGGG